MGDREKQYEREREAKEKLANDLVKYGNGKVSRENADQIAGDVARKQDQKKRSGRED
jgi:hypothetical protein